MKNSFQKKACKYCKNLCSEYDEFGSHLYDYCYAIVSKIGVCKGEGDFNFAYIKNTHEFFCSEFETKGAVK